MTWQLVFAFLALLIPVPLALLVRVESYTSADPHTVRRARYSATLFPLIVAISFAVYVIYLLIAVRPLQPDYVIPTAGLLIWIPMAWFFFANLICMGRIPATRPQAESMERSATLEPRHRASPIPLWAWVLVAGILGMSAAAIAMTADAFPILSWMLFVPAVLLLLLGPWLVRRILLSAEPIVPGARASVRTAYRQRRQLRCWWIYMIVTILASIKATLAVLFALGRQPLTLFIVSGLSVAVVLLGSAVFYVFDKRFSQSTANAMAGT